MAAAGEDGEAAAFRGGGQNGSYKGDYTCQVVLLQFRAPELLVGARRYGGGVDVWAAGGVLAEMILRPAPGEAPSGFFTSDQPNAPMCGDATQLRRMLDILGVPEDRYATGARSSPCRPKNKLELQIAGCCLTTWCCVITVALRLRSALADMGELPEIVPHMIPASRPPTFPVREDVHPCNLLVRSLSLNSHHESVACFICSCFFRIARTRRRAVSNCSLRCSPSHRVSDAMPLRLSATATSRTPSRKHCPRRRWLLSWSRCSAAVAQNLPRMTKLPVVLKEAEVIFLGSGVDPSSTLAAAIVELAAGRMLPDKARPGRQLPLPHSIHHTNLRSPCGAGVLRRQALFGSDESGSGYGGGGGSGEGWRSGGSGSNMGMDSVSAPVGAGGRLGGGGGGGLFGSGATRALFDSDDSDDPDL